MNTTTAAPAANTQTETPLPINRANITAWFQRLHTGSAITNLDNTSNPRPLPEMFTVTRAGRTTIDLTSPASPGFLLHIPARVSDVVSLTQNTITYLIGHQQHTATWAHQN